MINSFLIALTFLSVLPVPQKFIPEWPKVSCRPKNLRFFCVMIPVTGILFGLFWFLTALGLAKLTNLSGNLRGLAMTIFTLILTGGLHMDGLMDSFDAIFSRRDRETRLKILSDPHAGSFAVIGCVVVLTAKIFLFAEIFSRGIDINFLFLVPVYSRLGMAVLLNNLKFAKQGGLAVMLGEARNKRDNLFFMVLFLIINNSLINSVIFILSLIIWSKTCLKIFGGITGDLLGAFLELSEVLILTGTVIENCI